MKKSAISSSDRQKDFKTLLSYHIEDCKELHERLCEGGAPLDKLDKEILRAASIGQVNAALEEMKISFLTGNTAAIQSSSKFLANLTDQLS